MIKILIVDDNPYNREILKEVLESKGYLIEDASNGKDALEKIRDNTYQLILMDLLMPGMDGFELVKKIRDKGIVTPVIAQSSLSSREDRQRSLDVGCNDFLPKPLDIQKLVGIVEKYTLSEYMVGKPEQEKSKKESKSGFYTITTIMLVEEDDNLAAKLENIFTTQGYYVRREKNGYLAWERIKNKKDEIDIVISNIFTTGIDGYGLLVNVRNDDQKLPFLLYTLNFSNDTHELAIKLGADGLIPFSKFQTNTAEIIESAVYHYRGRKSTSEQVEISKQVREYQDDIISHNRFDNCDFIDICNMSLHAAGGDMVYLRKFNLAGRYGIFISDVAGHDVKSSYSSAILLGMLSTLWDSNQDPRTLQKTVNNELLKLGAISYHICSTSILWDQRRYKLSLSYAGSPGAVHLRFMPNGDFIANEIGGGGICLGTLDRSDLYVDATLDFLPGDILFLFSDGISKNEIMDVLNQHLNELNSNSIKGLSQKVINAIIAKKEQKDDMILVILRAPEIIHSDGEHYSILSGFKEINDAYLWLIQKINENNLPDGIDPDYFLIALRETILNAVEHGNKNNPSSYVDISIYRDNNMVRADVSDEGNGFDLNEKLKASEKLSGLQIGKRGLPLIDFATDKIEVDGGTVSLYFYGK